MASAARGSYAPTVDAVDAVDAVALLEVAEDAGARARRQEAAAFREVEARYPQVREALDRQLEAGQPAAGFRLASALVPFWISTARIDDGDAWFDRALGTTSGVDAGRARALYDHGYLVFWAGRYDVSQARFTEAMAAAEALGDGSLQGLVLAGSARVALSTDVAEAVRLLRQALVVTEDLDDGDPGRSSSLHVLGVALQMSGDLEGAREVMSARLATGRASGDPSIVWVESANLSMVERRLGHLERAEELSRLALQVVAVRGDEMPVAWVVNGLAAATAASGRTERAATLLGFAAAMLERAGGAWPPDEREQHEETLAGVRAVLHPDVLDAALARGAGLSAEDGVAYALHG
ncbi:hypothetical protein CBZ_05610 [Cellulomonas biazotea]|uniref:MalT-like TPR region domain-containing protein n=1 Tax=Cellulomonas biazotea TaxID=1709 RepID=A0A402DN06_9CELL|nr:hypothetical protein CBZ_05610 [Cellulomonas biazotea]